MIKIKLNKWEIEILKIAKEKGKITYQECGLIYRDSHRRREALMRLSQEGYINSKVPGVFTWTGKEFDDKPIAKKSIFTTKQQQLIKECLESCEGSELERTLREITKIN